MTTILRLLDGGTAPEDLRAALTDALGDRTAKDLFAGGVVTTSDGPVDWNFDEIDESSPGARIERTDVEPGGTYAVVGHVTANGSRRSSVDVRLFDGSVYDGEPLTAAEPIATDQTGPRGEFLLPYDPTDLADDDEGERSVVVAAFENDAVVAAGDPLSEPGPVEHEEVEVGETELEVGEPAPEAAASGPTGEGASEGEGERQDAEEGSPVADDAAEDVFEFMTVRPPEEADLGRFVEIDSASSELVGTVRSMREAENPRREAAETLVEHKESDAFVGSLDDLPLDVGGLRAAILESTPASAEGFEALVEEELGSPPAELLGSDEFEEAAGRLSDSLVASSLHPVGVDDETAAAIRDGVRIVDAIRRAASQPDGFDPAGILDRHVVLPEGIQPLPELPTSREPTEAEAAPTRDPATLASRLDDLRRARNEVAAGVAGGGAADLVSSIVENDGGDPDDEIPSVAEKAEQTRGELSGEAETDAEAAMQPGPTGPESGAGVDEQLGQAFENISRLVRQLQDTPVTRRLTDEGFQELSESSRTVLADLDVTPGTATVEDAVTRLDDEATTVNNELLEATVGAYERVVVTDDGLTLLTESTDGAAAAAPSRATSFLGELGDVRDQAGVTALGFGELRVVRQVGPKYEAGEIAHIENVMEGETRERVHRESTVTEETTRREEETTTTEKEDLQTTQRNEIKRESEKVIEEETNLETGVNVSAKYGPVKVDANFGYSRSRSKEKSERTAVNTAREITKRATRKVEKRVTTETIKRVREEITERNRHAFENDDPGHITGIYRWLDKTYRMDVHEYDEPRLMFEFFVPDPAAVLRHAMRNKPRSGTLEKPVEPKAVRFGSGVDSGPDRDEGSPVYLERLSYDDITPTNYRWYASHYGAEDVPEPPAYRRRRVVQLKGGSGETKKGDKEAPHYDSAMIDVPDGYKVEDVHVFSDWMHRRNHSIGAAIRVNVGVDDPGGGHRIQRVPHWQNESEQKADGATAKTFNVNSAEYDQLPVAVAVRNVFGYDVIAAAELVRTDDRLREWKADVHKAIMDAYHKRLDEFRKEVEAARIGGGVTIEGNNPKENRQTERTELKRGAIELLRQRELDYDAVTTPGEFGGSGGSGAAEFPTIDEWALDGLERDLQFFELAFEWQQGTYVFYPYYWADQDTWIDKLTRDNPDPKFETFLTAGAARFVVPVRPGYEPNVLLFMQTGIPFLQEGEIEDIEDRRYVDIVSEMRERDDAKRGSEYTGNHWFDTVPTSLVKLQGSDELPNMITPVEELYPDFEPTTDQLLEFSSAESGEVVSDGGNLFDSWDD